MVVIYGSSADYEASRIVADTFRDQLLQVTSQNFDQVWNAIENAYGVIILVGGENANPVTKKLVDLGLIKPVGTYEFKDKCTIQYAKYKNVIFYVLAGWEKEDTLWVAKVIQAYRSLPDMEMRYQITNDYLMVFDTGYIPRIYQVEFTFLTIPYVGNLAQWLYEKLMSLRGFKVYRAYLSQVSTGITTNYILTVEVGEPVVQQAGIPAVVLGIIAILVTIGAVLIAWRFVDIWSRREQVQLAKDILQAETTYQQEKLQLLQTISQIQDPELRQKALDVIMTTPSVLQQAVQQPTIMGEIVEIIKWGMFAIIGILLAYGGVKLISSIAERREVRVVQAVPVS